MTGFQGGEPGMRLHAGGAPAGATYEELRGIAPAVDALWTMHVTRAGNVHVLPDGCVDVIVRFNRGERHILLVGPAMTAHVVHPAEGESFVGLRFRPGRGGRIMDVEPAAIADQTVELSEVSPRLNAYFDDVQDIASARARLASLARSRDQRPPAAIDQAIETLCATAGSTSIADLARIAGLSPRTLHRRFVDYVGVAPKELARVLRMRRALSMLPRAPSLADLAAASGYADQAHMSRDFRALSGMSPREARNAGQQLVNALVTDSFKTG